MGGANRLVEVVAAAVGFDCAVFFDKDRDSFFFLAAGGEEPSSTSENQPSGTKYGSSETLAASSIFVATPDLTTNQLKYRLRSYSLEIIGLGESSRSYTRAARSCYMTFSNFPRAQ
jgi:hypothetical protein